MKERRIWGEKSDARSDQMEQLSSRQLQGGRGRGRGGGGSRQLPLEKVELGSKQLPVQLVRWLQVTWPHSHRSVFISLRGWPSRRASFTRHDSLVTFSTGNYDAEDNKMQSWTRRWKKHQNDGQTNKRGHIELLRNHTVVLSFQVMTCVTETFVQHAS